MSCLSVVGKNAQNAVYVNGVSDQAMDIMDASKKLAGAIAKMMKAAVAASEGTSCIDSTTIPIIIIRTLI